MMLKNDKVLVSVIIPCYNLVRYLDQAIQSVLNQTYHNVEIIVIDDGSTENIKVVTDQYPQVKYLYQDNQGPSAARNLGIRKSSGEILLFLDADDWLYPDGIQKNLDFLNENRDSAFVFGMHDIYYENYGRIYPVHRKLKTDMYRQLLESCVIGMPGVALFRRWVFEEFKFDESLKFFVEDYDLYLKIARKYPVGGHTGKIAVYRKHHSNASGNSIKMLKGVLMILERQEEHLRTFQEITSYRMGKIYLKKYYGNQLLKATSLNPFSSDSKSLICFFKSYPATFVLLLPKQLFRRVYMLMVAHTKTYAPEFILRFFYKAGLYRSYSTKYDSDRIG